MTNDPHKDPMKDNEKKSPLPLLLGFIIMLAGLILFEVFGRK